MAEENDQKEIILTNESTNKINQEGFNMKRALDNNKLMDALKHASNMIGELRTGLLSPKNYYNLYMVAFEQLRHLELFLYDEKIKNGKRIAELYELVQYAGNILPRLYLLCTVGAVYIKSKEAPAKDVLKDLVEMCKGVQHPTRGLFLRAYLSDMTKDKLPDKESEYSGEKGGDINDCIEFILINFVEMNKLWVRMQHQGSTRNKPKRERERRELAPLIGKNLSRLSSLDGVTLELYQNAVLPKILEQIISCKDKIAQQYLMECIIQVFPDEYHFSTLNELLDACAKMTSGVDLKTIVVSLINRLVAFVSNPQNKDLNLLKEKDIFPIFFDNIKIIISGEGRDITLEDTLAILTSLMDLSITCYPKRLDYVDSIFSATSDILTTHKNKSEESIQNPKVVKQLISFLRSPLVNFNNILIILQLGNYSSLLPFLSYDSRKKVSVEVLKSTIDSGVPIPNPTQVEALFGLIEPLVSDIQDQPQDFDEEEFREEQQLVAGLVHLFDNDELQSLFKSYIISRRFFGQGGKNRIKFTLPPLIFAVLRFARRMKAQTESSVFSESGQKVINFALETIKVYQQQVENPALSLRLYLQTAHACGECGFEDLAYDCVTKCFKIYEESISDTQQQIETIHLFVGSFYNIDCFSQENFETIITKTAKHCASILDKSDQSDLISLAAHLFWTPTYKNQVRVLECLKRALKIADNVLENKSFLFVSLLNRYFYFFDQGNEEVTHEQLNNLVNLVRHTFEENDSNPNDNAKKFLENIRNYANLKKKTDSNKYSPINI
eukprot:TRINITY_DN8892_c0_g1_i1.p1 TRINITY_DN8892_c0_g1~~TRINITY_DN8892_c0_g1_i1.p1  ORF type:complete len:782 (-),score=256.05 TRINITY_DN8892_c0_g1_i1:69-2414(-)